MIMSMQYFYLVEIFVILIHYIGNHVFLVFQNADSIVRQLRQQLLAIDRPHIEQCQTQRAWLTHASRIWDMITKSSQVEKFYFLLYLNSLVFCL